MLGSWRCGGGEAAAPLTRAKQLFFGQKLTCLYADVTTDDVKICKHVVCTCIVY